jgi:hypothetical protein
MRKKIILSIIILLILLVVFWVINKTILNPEKIREPRLDMSSLLLQQNDLLPGTTIAYGPEKMKAVDGLDWGEESQMIAFKLQNSNGYIHQYAYRFYNKRAASIYQDEMEKFYGYGSERCKNIAYESPTAEVWDIWCVPNDVGGYVYEIYSRYDEIVVVLSMTYKDNTYSINELNQLFKTFDSRITDQLKISKQVVAPILSTLLGCLQSRQQGRCQCIRTRTQKIGWVSPKALSAQPTNYQLVRRQ